MSDTVSVMSVAMLYTCCKNDWRRRVDDEVDGDRDLYDDDVQYGSVANGVDSNTCHVVCTESCVRVCRIVYFVRIRT